MENLKIQKVNTLTVCRICLQDSGDDMTSIYDRDPEDASLCLYEKIEKCGGIKIITDPELPTRICKKCNAFLRIAHKFRIICKNSDNYLREFVSKGTETCDDDLNTEADGAMQLLQHAGHDLHETEIDYTQHNNDDEHYYNYESDDTIEETKPNVLTQQPTPHTSTSLTKNESVEPAKTQKQLIKEKQVHICEICGNSYLRKYALEEHMRRHRNERPFECEICDKAFHINSQLIRHMRRHTGQRPYICQYCKRSFALRGTMMEHERIHRNERPYVCETCGKSFTYSSVLKKHKLTHTGEKPYSCGICDKRFGRDHHLRAHLETLLHQNDPRAKELIKNIKRDDLISDD